MAKKRERGLHYRTPLSAFFFGERDDIAALYGNRFIFSQSCEPQFRYGLLRGRQVPEYRDQIVLGINTPSCVSDSLKSPSACS